MPYCLVDTHCHLDFPEFKDDRNSILETCRSRKINAIVIPGVRHEDWHRLLTVCQEPMLFPALGLHPCFISEHQPDDLEALRHYCHNAKSNLLAIGEIGLDYYLKDLDQDKQGYYFNEQLAIAVEFELPVLIHARKSHHQIISCIRQYPGLKGIIHAYSGSYEQAVEYLKYGFKLGFGGAFTYPQATKLRKVAQRLPLDAWVLETDAPDMSPVQHYKQRNSPEYLSEIVLELSRLSNQDVNQVKQYLYYNTMAIFPSLAKILVDQ